MTGRKWLVVAGVLVAVWIIADLWQLGQRARARQTTFHVQGASYRVTGPYAHENLAVFLIHAPTQDEREFITLDQGLKDGSVKITEKGEGQVSELVLDNQNDLPLFLQEGDRVKGGKQDRTIASSFVIPPKSGPAPLPAFCIEHGRWAPQQVNMPVTAGRSTGSLAFDYTANSALAPKEVRQAAKLSASQPEVWEKVSEQKAVAYRGLGAANTNTSLNETLDSPEVQKLSDEFANALSDVLKRHQDAVGVAIVVNGEIEEVNIYPNHGLLKKLYPRLLQSYALAAALKKEQIADTHAVAAKDVCSWMTASKETSQLSRQVDGRNTLDVKYLEGDKAAACTTYQMKPVHLQYMSRAPAAQPAAARQAMPTPQPSQPSPRLP